MMKINKSKLNLVIDIIMFINMMIIAGIGFLIKYILVPGSERNEIYGRDVELYYWGLDRHQWGYIHLIAGFVLLFLLLLHIIFHWKMIVTIYRNLISNRILRYVLTIGFILTSILFGVIPLFVKPEVSEDITHHHYRRENKEIHEPRDYNEYSLQDTTINYGLKDSITKSEPALPVNSDDKLHQHEHENHSIEIYGSMTLNDVAKKFIVPLTDLASSIHVPVSRSNERLGRLRKEYSFNMDDLRDFVESEIHKKQSAE